MASIDDLATLEAQLIELARQLSSDPSLRLAAPFVSGSLAAQDDTDILLVGKATAGEWYSHNYSFDPSPEARRSCTVDFLRWVASGGYKSAFWSFAKGISAKTARDGASPLSNLVWSNVAKLGVTVGNPEGRVLAAQTGRCAELLAAEIAYYKPKIVVFVTGSYGGAIIEKATGTQPTAWEHSATGSAWLRAQDGYPPMLLLPHPQGKSREKTETWIATVARLAGGENIQA
ncbi:hypothetical protein D3273_19245 [Lichenibacterium minor]|uniref:Uracil-DNA glycosylase n=1 Tax=Lichenibacterium minor TaxID=2316528 RepID=A0A4Q2U635_9HYPH|nr:hypothetical protein [Lichenibacterium minor]RYC30305.1 hypothetical protein D3273_19245 [Lichenibacterium minor]